jgi:hypothetical protein
MIIVCSGEGVSDLGSCSDQLGYCQGGTYTLGPLIIVLDNIIEDVLQFSPISTCPDVYRYYSESFLMERLAQKKGERKGFILSGAKHGVETGFFYRNAMILGEIAKELEVAENDTAVAVFFRDTDGTNSAPRDIWEKKRLSISEGFKRAGFENGVPMLPRPKSESWFICAMKEQPYQHCAALEDLSGNDKSPNAAKKQLAGEIGVKASAENLHNWLSENRLKVGDLAEQMPSFSAFYERMRYVLQAL